MIRNAFAAALLATAMVVGTAQAAPGRDPNADQGTGFVENQYGVGPCDADAPVYDDMPSGSDCGRTNGDEYANQGPQGADD